MHWRVKENGDIEVNDTTLEHFDELVTSCNDNCLRVMATCRVDNIMPGKLSVDFTICGLSDFDRDYIIREELSKDARKQ